jgi:hypothetical protein
VDREWFGGKAARIAAATMVAAALAFGASACGDDDDDDAASEETTEEAASVEEVTVTATEYAFDLSATPTAETTSITFDNQGEKPHVLVYGTVGEGFTVDEAVELQGRQGSATTLAQAQARPGKSVTVDVTETPEPGSYVMLCPIQDEDGKHWQLGQLEEFEIE